MTTNKALPHRAPDRTTDKVSRAKLALNAGGFDGFKPLAWSKNTGARVLEALRAWDPGELAAVPVGRSWDVLRMERSHGWRTVEALRTAGADIGPVLHSPGTHIDVLVPIGSLNGWDQRGAAPLPLNDMLLVPHPAVVSPETVRGRSWLIPPMGSTLTDGCALYEAYASAGASVITEGCTDVHS